MNINNINNIKSVLNIIRRTTTIIKLIPFVVVICILIDMLLQLFCSIEITDSTDLLVYQSPLNILFLIILSHCLKLCIWHRLECALPLTPMLSVFVDEHICNLSQYATYVNYAIVVFIFAASLINAYFVFIKPNKQ